MIVGTILKQPSERFPVSVDFAPELPAGESIGSVAVTSTRRRTSTSTTSTVVDGAATLTGAVVNQILKAGAAGDDHLVQFRVTTTPGAFVLEHELLLQVREAA